MGILYNRFTIPPATGSWELIDTFTEVRTWKTINTTGKTELLVVCNDIVSALFAVCAPGTYTTSPNNNTVAQIYSANTGTGYGFTVQYDFGTPNRLYVWGYSYPNATTETYLSSVNTKVYAR